VAVLVVLASSLTMAWTAESKALPRSAPEEQGVASGAILDFVNEAEAKIDALHSVMVVRHGKVIAEGWWAPYAAEEPHLMFSLSKSFTSTAVGLAIAEGKLKVDDEVLKFFPDEAPAKPSANLKAMRLRDLLTMAAGHHVEDLQGFSLTTDESVVKRFLALPVAHKPGTFFAYSTAATFMQSAMVQKVTGQTVLEYLRPRLFEPLGIENPTWEATKQGVSQGGTGLSIRTEDIAKFGQLYLQKGMWNGKQLVPAAWVETATARWMSNGSNPESDWEQGYGFQFWRCRYGVIRGDGAHGQFCIIMPELDAVVAITAGTRNLQGVLNVVWAKLLPALQAKTSGTLAADAAAERQLRGRLAGLALKTPVAVAGGVPAMVAVVAGKRFVFPKNALAAESVMLAPMAGDPRATEFVATIGGVEQRAKVAAGAWVKGELDSGPSAGPVAVSGAWTAADTFTLDVVRYHTPFAARYRLKFSADGESVTLETQPNVGPAMPASTGKRK
jgi:CubicO group peptidase (beta-lactamase class C family)